MFRNCGFAACFRQLDPFLHQLPVRDDIQVPLAELIDFALLFADHDRHAGLAHPVDLPAAVDLLLFVGGLRQSVSNSRMRSSQYLSIRLYIRTQVILSMQTSIALPVSQALA